MSEQPPPSGAQPSAVDRAKEAAGGAQEQARAAVDTAKQKAGEVAERATATADAGLDRAAGGLEGLASTVRERGQTTGGGATQQAATKAADALETASGYLREKDTDQLIADLEGLIRRRPVESLLVAAGLGFLVARALR